MRRRSVSARRMLSTTRTSSSCATSGGDLQMMGTAGGIQDLRNKYSSICILRGRLDAVREVARYAIAAPWNHR